MKRIKPWVIIALVTYGTLCTAVPIVVPAVIDHNMYGRGQENIIARHVDTLKKLEYNGHIYVNYSSTLWSWSPDEDMLLIPDGDAWVAEVPFKGYRTKLYADNEDIPNFLYVRRSWPKYVREDFVLPSPTETTYDKIHIKDKEIFFTNEAGDEKPILLSDIISIETGLAQCPQNAEKLGYIDIFCSVYAGLYLDGVIYYDQSTDTYYFHGYIGDENISYYEIINEQLLTFLKNSTQQV